jgi:ligand-binding sensor domain-containing protein
MTLRHLLFFVHALLISAIVEAQLQPQADLIFRHLRESDGLSQNTVNCFLQDRNGMLWVGTYSGLNRYDGAHFKVFKQTKDTFSLPQNTIHNLCEDRLGNIWGGTEEGIFCYSPSLNRFKNYKKTITGSKIKAGCILCDREGDIWAAGSLGFLKYNPTQDKFYAVHSNKANYDFKKPTVHKNGMVEDPSGEGIWLSSRNGGLLYYEKASGRFLQASNQVNSAIFSDHSISALSIAVEAGRMWGFDNKTHEIIQFDRFGEVYRRISVANDLPNAQGATLFEDREQRLWYASWYPSMAMIQYRDGVSIQKLTRDPGNSAMPIGDFFWNVWQNTDGSIWLGTLEGISICNPNRSFYKIHRLSILLPEILQHDFAINAIAENPKDGSWWIPTNVSKIIHYWPKTGQFQIYDTQKAPLNALKLPIGQVYEFRFFEGKVILISGNGAWTFLENTKRFTPFEVPKKPDFKIRDVLFMGDSVRWCVDEAHILRWDRKKGKTQIFGFERDTFPDGQKPYLYNMRFDPTRQRIWMIATDKMLAYFDLKDQKLTPFLLSQEDLTERIGGFMGLNVDQSGKLWIPFKGQGLYSYNPLTQSATLRREADGLAYENIISVSVDNKERIWCGSYNKISVFDPIENWFYNFNMPAHYRSAGYLNRSTQLANGHILISFDGDLVEFFPEKIGTQSAPTTPLLSQLQIGNDQQLLTNENLATLAPEENTIGFQFGTLADPIFSPTDLFYRLDGVNTQWIAANNTPEVVYTNLTSGTYHFHLIAKSKNGQFSSQERTIKLIISRKIYQQWWFVTTVLLLTGLLGYLFYRRMKYEKMKLTKLETRAESLEKEKTLVLYENLKQHLNPHFLFNSLTSLSSLIRIDPPMASDFLDKMSRVYRYILRSREQETVPLGQELNFVKLYVALQKTRFEEGLIVNIDISEDYHDRKIAPVTLQNLVENAIKHNSTDIDDPLTIELFIEDEYLTVRNNLRKRAFVETSNKQGLQNMTALYSYLSERPLLITEDEDFFIVKVPLLTTLSTLQ